MKRTVLITMLTFYALHIQAQWVGSLQTGSSASLKSPATDSVFAAAKKGLHIQATASYFFGHLGIGFTAGYMQQNLKQKAEAGPPVIASNHINVTSGGFSALYLLAGPDVCISCGSRVRLNLHWRGGISIPFKKPAAYRDDQVIIYNSRLITKAPFTTITGASVYHAIGSRAGIGINVDHLFMKTSVSNFDVRYSGTSILERKISVLNVATNFIYIF